MLSRTLTWCDIIWVNNNNVANRSSNSCVYVWFLIKNQIIFTSSEENEDQNTHLSVKNIISFWRELWPLTQNTSIFITIADSIILHRTTALQIQSNISEKWENECIHFGQCAMTQSYIIIFEVHGRTFRVLTVPAPMPSALLLFVYSAHHITASHFISRWSFERVREIYSSFSRNGHIYSLHIRTRPSVQIKSNVCAHFCEQFFFSFAKYKHIQLCNARN